MYSKIIIVAIFCTLSIAYGRPPIEEKEEIKQLGKRAILTASQEELADVSAPTLRHTRAIPESQEELADVSAPTLRHTRDIPESEEELADVSAPTRTIRQKRATCDLLSGLGVNHSACAAHCIAIGRKGGYCNDQAVCVCRN